MIDVNVGAAPWLTQAVVPYLRDRGSGSIVHVAARPGNCGCWPPAARASPGGHRIPVMRGYLPALDHGVMDPAPRRGKDPS